MIVFFEAFHVAWRNGEAVYSDSRVAGNSSKIPAAARASGSAILADLCALILRDLAALQASG